MNIEKFSPQKAELQALSQKYISLEINGINDISGYAIVDEARKDLKRKRVAITNTGKELRQEALVFQRKVIAVENELVAIIEPVEKELKAKQETIDKEKLRIQRREILPTRVEKLAKIGVVLEDNILLDMTAEDYDIFYNEKNAEYLAEKERKLKEEEDRINREKEIEEARKKAREEAERQAKLEAEKKAREVKEEMIKAEQEAKAREDRIRKEAEEAQRLAVESAKRKAEEEKQALIDAQRKVEEEAERKRKEAEEKSKKEKEENDKLEKKKKYQEFLLSNGFTEETKSEFYVQKTETDIILYKKVATFNYLTK